ncbi:MFS domain-containing protein [Fusarium sp. LHS14.1]|nr:MFS domain-containing protein [Fusarium sp. LHS14.1]
MADENTPTPADERQTIKPATMPDEDEHVNFTVGWEEPPDQDPENPLNWSASRKWSIIGILSFITFLTPLASAMMAPGVPVIMAEFSTSDEEVATFMVSVFVLGFAFGPLLMAPLSELYGRLPVYHVCNSLFVIFSIGCAVSQNIGMLIAFRFLSGFVGVATVTCGSGTIADMVPPEKRGAAMSIWSIGPLLGPVIGPVCAGFLVEAKGWRWVFWIITIVSGAVILASFVVFRETYAPVILERKAAKLRKSTGVTKYRSAMQATGSSKEIFISAITRPMRMLLFSPIVTMVCLYIATLYGMLYLLFTTFTFVYHDMYGFSAVSAGLSFIAGGVGNLLGLMFVGYLSDKLIKDSQSAGKAVEPEQRLDLRLTVPTALALPIGLIIYGWTAEKQLHWIVPMIGTGIMGFGMIGIFMISQTYLVDAFTRHAASVTAANAVLRSLLGALLPLCGLKLYDGLGLGWGNTLLGLISLALAPVPWLLNRFGGRIRENPKFRQKF